MNLLLLAAALSATLSAAPYSPDSGSLDVRCGALIDGVAAQPRRNVVVRIREGRVASIEAAARVSRTSRGSIPTLDLAGYTCLPGLIEMHTHITELSEDMSDLTVYFRRTPEEQLVISRRNAEATLLAGFTSARNVGAYIRGPDIALRDAINRGEVVGPRLQVSGYYLTIPGGGGDLLVPGVPAAETPENVRSGIAKGPEQFRLKAQRAIDSGVDLLKIIASGAVLAYGGVPGEPEMNPEEIAVVVQVAHASGRKVAAHAHGARSIKEAIRAGVDTIEHASLIDDEGIALAREQKVALSMDVYNGDYIDSEGRAQGWPEEFLRKNTETTEAQRQGFTRAHAAGVPIVFGTDAGVYPHGLNARQFPIMVARGMKPIEAIRAATSVSALYMGWGDRVGHITPGNFGDLIAVKGDPLADIALLQSVAVVVKGGLVFKLPPP